MIGKTRQWACLITALCCISSPIYTVAADNPTDPTTVTFGDGNRLRFLDQETGTEIWRMTHTGDSRVLYHTRPAYSPDGKHIVFTSKQDGDAGFGLYLMEADGSGMSKFGDWEQHDAKWTHQQGIGQWSHDGRHYYANSGLMRINLFEPSSLEALPHDPANWVVEKLAAWDLPIQYESNLHEYEGWKDTSQAYVHPMFNIMLSPDGLSLTGVTVKNNDNSKHGGLLKVFDLVNNTMKTFQPPVYGTKVGVECCNAKHPDCHQAEYLGNKSYWLGNQHMVYLTYDNFASECSDSPSRIRHIVVDTFNGAQAGELSFSTPLKDAWFGHLILNPSAYSLGNTADALISGHAGQMELANADYTDATCDGRDYRPLVAEGVTNPYTGNPIKPQGTHGSFSPDGRWMVVENDIGDDGMIYVYPVNNDTTFCPDPGPGPIPESIQMIRQVRFRPGGAGLARPYPHPTWSPDSTKLIFSTGCLAEPDENGDFEPLPADCVCNDDIPGNTPTSCEKTQDVERRVYVSVFQKPAAPSQVSLNPSAAALEINWKPADHHREIKHYEIHYAATKPLDLNQDGQVIAVHQPVQAFVTEELTGVVSDTQIDIELDNVSGFPIDGGRVEIAAQSSTLPSEFITYQSISGTTLVGCDRSAGIPHYNDAFVWLDTTQHGAQISDPASGWYWIRAVEHSGLKSTPSTPVQYRWSLNANDHLSTQLSHVGIGTDQPQAQLHITDFTSQTVDAGLQVTAAWGSNRPMVLFSHFELDFDILPPSSLLKVHGDSSRSDMNLFQIQHKNPIPTNVPPYPNLFNVAGNGSVAIGLEYADRNAHLHVGGFPSSSNPGLRVSTPNWNEPDQPMVAFEPQGGDGLILRVSGGADQTNRKLAVVENLHGTVLQVRGDGNVGIGENAAHELDVAGDVQSSGQTITSDARLKTDIMDMDQALAAVTNLRGVSFSWLNAGPNAPAQIGLIAQEVAEVLPELVQQDETGRKLVNYPVLSALLATAIKEQHQLLQQRDRTIIALEEEAARIQELKTRIQRFESLLQSNQTQQVSRGDK